MSKSISKSLIKKPTQSVQQANEPISGWPLPFVSFSYSYREINFTDDGQAQVSAQEIRYENGRLTEESFSGVTGATPFFQMIGEIQAQMMRQMLAFWQPFGLFAPSRTERKE